MLTIELPQNLILCFIDLPILTAFFHACNKESIGYLSKPLAVSGRSNYNYLGRLVLMRFKTATEAIRILIALSEEI